MLCDCCKLMLREQQGFQWRGSYDLHFRHHENEKALRESAKTCFICQTITRKLHRRGLLDFSANQQEDGRFRASLSSLPDNKEDYLLEFYRQDLNVGAFTLQHSVKPPSSTPRSNSTCSDETFQLIRSWIKRCECVNADDNPVYPTRLIDLHDLKERIHLEAREPTGGKDAKKKPLEVRLVDWACLLEEDKQAEEGESIKKGKQKNPSYVTLSHCWGQADVFKLTKGTYEDCLQGIQLGKLPLTFQNAMKFAARLEQVRYIWIDSLCIIQGDKQDWFEQSRQMADIYGNAFLNIAATAATDSYEGLYSSRDRCWLWNDEIDLDVYGMPGIQSSSIRRCTIADVSFWDECVDRAPLNTRGWVLQELYMSPRQVNFCSGQVTWECREGRKSERQPEGLPRFNGRAREFVRGAALERTQLNGASAETNGNEDPSLAYGSWKHIVERYTGAKLTKPEDKLIALSGIAQRMHSRINRTPYSPQSYDPQNFNPDSYDQRYLAGMWEHNLQHQLLWYVEPFWDARNQRFHYPSTRPKEYRAPSWSWAAVDADHGITYGEILEHELLFKVVDVSVSPKDGGLFGAVEHGSLVLASDVQPQRVELQGKEENGGMTYSWKMVESDGTRVENKFCIVWLDSPTSDCDIFGADGQIFCLPAASRYQKTEYTCLLLQELSLQELPLMKRDSRADQRRYFKRVGLTCIPGLDVDGKKRVESWNAGIGKGRYEFCII